MFFHRIIRTSHDCVVVITNFLHRVSMFFCVDSDSSVPNIIPFFITVDAERDSVKAVANYVAGWFS